MRKAEFTVGRLESRVTAYLVDDLTPYGGLHPRHGALIVIPGGGYNHVSARESDPVALRFLAHGVDTFILHYPVGDDISREKPVDTLEALVDHLVEHAQEYGIDPGRIAIIGFSAGGHLAASYATLRGGRNISAMILGYPVITSGDKAHTGSFDMLCQSEEERRLYSLEKRVDSSCVPTFIFHSADDATVPVDNSLLFASALAENGVPFELHIYPSARHGTSVGTDEVGIRNPVFAGWFDNALRWLFDIWDYTE